MGEFDHFVRDAADRFVVLARQRVLNVAAEALLHLIHRRFGLTVAQVHPGVVDGAAQRLQDRDGSVADVAVVLRGRAVRNRRRSSASSSSTFGQPVLVCGDTASASTARNWTSSCRSSSSCTGPKNVSSRSRRACQEPEQSFFNQYERKVAKLRHGKVQRDPDPAERRRQGALCERDLLVVEARATGGPVGLQFLPDELGQRDGGVEIVDSVHWTGAQLAQQVLAELGGGPTESPWRVGLAEEIVLLHGREATGGRGQLLQEQTGSAPRKAGGDPSSHVDGVAKGARERSLLKQSACHRRRCKTARGSAGLSKLGNFVWGIADQLRGV